MPASKRSNRTRNIMMIVGALVLIAVIIWIDLATGVWNDLVIIAGLAAGLVTFLLTVLVLDKLVARATERKWAPVNRLALSEFLHAIADEEHSEISRGHIVPRSLPHIEQSEDSEALHTQLHALRHEVVKERRHLSDSLSRWAEFLSASGNNEQVLRHIADIALQLDRVRDSALEAEQSLDASAFAGLAADTTRCNELLLSLESELRKQIAHEDQLAR